MSVMTAIDEGQMRREPRGEERRHDEQTAPSADRVDGSGAEGGEDEEQMLWEGQGVHGERRRPRKGGSPRAV